MHPEADQRFDGDVALSMQRGGGNARLELFFAHDTFICPTATFHEGPRFWRILSTGYYLPSIPTDIIITVIIKKWGINLGKFTRY